MTAVENDPLLASFLEVMAGVCAPVAVVTTAVNGLPHGATVSAFASLSLHPPMVMLALGRASRLAFGVAAARRFGVNVLASDQIDVAQAFGRRGGQKFDHIPWRFDQGLPRLSETPGWLVCEVSQMVDGGDHVVVFGSVTAGVATPRPPLTYYRRSFGTHAALT
jgi:flavin reductase (DIM6/NTAB) family NADH-FMN oxidoreductase RutF